MRTIPKTRKHSKELIVKKAKINENAKINEK